MIAVPASFPIKVLDIPPLAILSPAFPPSVVLFEASDPPSNNPVDVMRSFSVLEGPSIRSLAAYITKSLAKQPIEAIFPFVFENLI